MRITSNATVVERFADSTGYDGGYGVYIDTTASYVTRTFSRSDVRRNPKGAGNWRDPSAYEALVTSAESGFTDILVDSPPNQRKTRIRGKINVNVADPVFKITDKHLTQLFPSARDVDIAVIKARNNVADRVASFGESLVELMQTVQSLGALAQQVNQFLDAAASKNYGNIARSLGLSPRSRKHRRAVERFKRLSIRNLGVPTVSNAFLCWNFGLQPIISDMVALAILIGEGKNLRVVGKGTSGKSKTRQVIPYDFLVPYGGTAAPYTVRLNEVVEKGVYVRLDYEVSIEGLRQLTSYGLTDAPTTLWAVAPYSWLVDFVLPVSEVLRSLTATLGLQFLSGTATRWVKVKNTYHSSDYGPGTWAYEVQEFRVSVDPFEGFKMQRSVFLTEPNPVTLWIKDPLKAFNVAAIFSLLGQKLGNKSNITK